MQSLLDDSQPPATWWSRGAPPPVAVVTVDQEDKVLFSKRLPGLDCGANRWESVG